MAPVFVLTIIMIIAGAAGRFVNFLLSQSIVANSISEASAGERPFKWWSYLITGIVATFIVPLFLSLAQSSLFESMFNGDGLAANKVFVFVGFCLIASISSRAFVQTVSPQPLHSAPRSAGLRPSMPGAVRSYWRLINRQKGTA